MIQTGPLVRDRDSDALQIPNLGFGFGLAQEVDFDLRGGSGNEDGSYSSECPAARFMLGATRDLTDGIELFAEGRFLRAFDPELGQRRMTVCGKYSGHPPWSSYPSEEQRYWYQVLQFSLDADAVRCVPCRKMAQGTSRLIERYEELVHAERNTPQQFEFAEAIMGLLERRAFGPSTVYRLRGTLNCLPDGDRLSELRRRLAVLLERGAPRELVIRPVGEEDRSQVLQLVRGQGAHGSTDAFHATATDDEIGGHWFSDGQRHPFMAIVEDELIGAFVLWRDHPGQSRHVARASFTVSGQARKHGVARKLIVAGLEAAKELGYRALQVRLWVDDYTLPLSLWESLGFEAVGIVPGGILNSEGALHDFYILHRAWACGTECGSSSSPLQSWAKVLDGGRFDHLPW